MGHPGFNRQWARIDDEAWRQHQRRGGRRGGPWGDWGGCGRPRPPGPAAVGGRPLRPRLSRAAARAAGPPRRRPLRHPRRAPHGEPRRAGAGQRLPGHPADRRAQRGGVAAQPRLGLPDHPAAPGRGPGGDRRRARPQDAGADRRGRDVRRRARRRAGRGVGGRSIAASATRRRRFADLKPEIGQVMGAVWQIVTSGSERSSARRSTCSSRPGASSTASSPTARTPTTDEEAPSHERPDIRLSDAEREAAAADLGEHFAQGRLTADEHAERLEQVWAAKTRGEVAPIFRDLPSPYAAVASAPTVRS